MSQKIQQAYGNVIILESLAEHTGHRVLVRPFDDSRSGRENAVGGLSQTSIGGLARLEENPEELRPLVA
jgi:hypothetical protein